MAGNFDDIIDLSDSFILADHRALTNVVIELDTDESSLIELDTDDSTVEHSHSTSSTTITNLRQVCLRKPKRKMECNPFAYIHHKQETELKNHKLINKIDFSEKQTKFGDCPICFDPLGQNPLASTKCGHVYCMKCIKQYLLVDQRCPTCRQILRGKSSYHPLYLNT